MWTLSWHAQRTPHPGVMRHAAASADKSNDFRRFTLLFATAWFFLSKRW